LPIEKYKDLGDLYNVSMEKQNKNGNQTGGADSREVLDKIIIALSLISTCSDFLFQFDIQHLKSMQVQLCTTLKLFFIKQKLYKNISTCFLIEKKKINYDCNDNDRWLLINKGNE